MKQKIVLSAILISGLILAGCQSNSKQSTASNAAKTSTEAVKPNLGQVAGQSYTGTHKGNGKSTDPTYVYKISFNNDGSFGQEIISSDGYAARFIQQGTYKYDQAKKQIVLKLNKVTETSYQSDGDLQDSHNPVRLSVRTDDGASSLTKLNAAENKSLIVKDKQSYLLGMVNNVKLTKDSNPVKSFNTLASSEVDAYSTKGQIINQKTFNAKLGTSRIWMTFNDDGTWQCRIIDGTHRWDIYDQGTWTVNNGRLALTTTGDVHEFTIVGDTTNPTKYSNVTTDSSRVTDNFIWKISGNDLVITSKQDSGMTANMQVKLSKVTQPYTVAQSETKKASNSTTDIFGSQDDFKEWLNIHSGSAATYARDMTKSQNERYENKFKEAFDGIEPLYICKFYNGVSNKGISKKMAISILLYASDGKVHELKKNTWKISSYTRILSSVATDKARNGGKISSSSDYPQPVTINNKEDFGEWIDGLIDSKTKNNYNFKLYTSNVTSKDYYKGEFTSEVNGVTPLYYVSDSAGHGKIYSTGTEWIYGDDGKVYSHFTNNGPKWHVDRDLSSRIQNGED